MKRALLLVLVLGAGCPPEDVCDGGWTQVLSATDLDRSVLALWGHDSTVYAVGGGLGVEGAGALALRYDGTAWQEIQTGRDETLWWVWGTDDGEHVWMVGEGGLILRYTAQTGAVTPLASGTTATLYGVWGTGPDDVWIVGGTPGAGTSSPNDVVLHWDGQDLTASDAPTAAGHTFFKVWGAGGELWVSGERGSMWRRVSTGEWQDFASQLGTQDSLLTVHGCSTDEVYAVGGQHVYGFDGSVWSEVPGVSPGATANGVHCSASGVLVVGFGGLKLRFDRTAGEWLDETIERPYSTDFHAALTDDLGGVWAGGGNFVQPASFGPREGVIAFRGCPVPNSTIR
jgi:hypothetical protein